MTKKKAPKRTYVAEISLKTTLAELVPAKKAGRAPKQVGQGRSTKNVRLHGLTFKEIKKRIDAAEAILKTGKVPKEKETPPPPAKEDPVKKELHEYLEKNEVEFHPQLGVKKLQALVDEHKASKPQPPPIEEPVEGPVEE